MPDANEVYSWYEGAIFIYTAAAGQTGSTPQAFVREMELGQAWDWARKLSPESALMRQRVTYSLQDRPVQLNMGLQFAGMALFQMAQSATAINADLQLSAYAGGTVLASAAFRCLSGRFTEFRLVGQEDGLWNAQVGMVFAEASALWI